MKQKARRPARPRPPQPASPVNRYLYEKIYNELKAEILSGKYARGDWFPPERTLKERFGTTHLTVRNALAKLVLEGYIERYSGKGTLVIYARDRVMAPRKLLTFPWAQAIVEHLDEANSMFLESLEARLRKIPLPLRVCCHQGDVPLGRTLWREAQESGALVILQPPGDPPAIPDAPVRNTVLIRARGIASGCPQVAVDEAEGSRRAVRYLHDLGYDRIALLAAAESPDLVRGFREELAADGLDGPVDECPPGFEAGRQAVARLLRQEPRCRAFLCASDLVAAGAAAGLGSAGLQPGRDCSVIGFGNSLLGGDMGLTSIDPCFDRLAEKLAAIVRDAMRRGAFEAGFFRILPELRVRSSCVRAGPTPVP